MIPTYETYVLNIEYTTGSFSSANRFMQYFSDVQLVLIIEHEKKS